MDDSDARLLRERFVACESYLRGFAASKGNLNVTDVEFAAAWSNISVELFMKLRQKEEEGLSNGSTVKTE